MDKKFHLTVSAIITICIYILFLFLIVLYLKNDLEEETLKYSSMPKETSIELDFVVENNNKSDVQSVEENFVQEESIEEDTEKLSETPKVDTNLKSLFSNVSDIGTKTTHKSEIQEVPQQQIISRFKSNLNVDRTSDKIELSKLADIKNLPNQTKDLSIPSNKGNFDEYYSMINSYILRRWYNYPLITDVNYLVSANITIDSSGNFSFVMLKFSGDNRVDEAIKQFLKNQTLGKYPISPDKTNKTIKINFLPFARMK